MDSAGSIFAWICLLAVVACLLQVFTDEKNDKGKK